jgi:hypothetical protein
MARVTIIGTLILVMGTAIGVTNAQRRPPSEPNYDAFYELGPDSLVRRGVPTTGSTCRRSTTARPR